MIFYGSIETGTNRSFRIAFYWIKKYKILLKYIIPKKSIDIRIDKILHIWEKMIRYPDGGHNYIVI